MKANKLKDLKVTSVDLVEAGANQHAHIQLKKRREDGAEPTPSEPTDTALFARIGAYIAKALHITKGEAHTFSQAETHRDINEIVWDISDAMCESLRSILGDNDLSAAEKRTMLSETADQVRDAILTNLGAIADETPAPEVSKAEQPEDEPDDEDSDDGDEQTEKGCKKPTKTAKAANKEGESTMPYEIDTANLTPEEKAQFELYKSKLVVKSAAEPNPAPANPPVAYDPEKDEVAKAMRTEIEALRKNTEAMRDQLEQRELEAVAKKYEVLGKKPEELVPVLKSMKAAGDAVYNEYIKTLDENLDTVEKSGVFGEIGKRGTNAASDPVQKVYAAAEEIRKSNPSISHAEAIDQAWAQHPELIAEYEQSR